MILIGTGSARSARSGGTRRRRAMAALAGLLALAGVVSSALPAHAYAASNGWRNGTTRASEPALVVGSNRIYQPPVVMERNGAVPYGTPQYVYVTYQLEIWTSAGWQRAGAMTVGRVISENDGSVGLDGVYLQPSSAFPYAAAKTGYWRVSYLYRWGGPVTMGGDVAGTTGRVDVTLTRAAELRCQYALYARCQSNNGFAVTW